MLFKSNIKVGTELIIDVIDNKSFEKVQKLLFLHKVVVIKKADSFTFDRFLDRIQQRDTYDLKIQEDFSEFEGSNVADDGLEVEDTTSLLSAYVDNVETVLDKERIKGEVLDLMTEAQSQDVV